MLSAVRSSAVAFAALLVLLCVAFPLQSQAQSGASVSGTVADELGSPIAGAAVNLRGPSVQTTVSDTAGAFSFSKVTPGVYVLSVTKPGYATAVQNDVVLLGGQATSLAVRLGAATLSSLRTIASVRANGRGNAQYRRRFGQRRDNANLHRSSAAASNPGAQPSSGFANFLSVELRQRCSPGLHHDPEYSRRDIV